MSPEHAALGDDLWTRWHAGLHALTAGLLAPGADGPLAACAAAVAAIDAQPAGDMPWAGRLALAQRGSFAFAIAARLAFAGEAQLRSAVIRGALDPERVAQWKRAAGALPLAQADRAHGHLRPGTMDITQPTWDDSGYQAQAGHGAGAAEHAVASLNAQEARAVSALLREACLDLAPTDWLAFVQQARVLRERARHVFTRHLSVAMDLIAADAERHGVARETLSWLSLAQWKDASRQASHAGWRSLEATAAQARRQHADQATVVVAPLLAHARDRWMADSQGVLPNFIGSQAVQGPVRCLHDARARGDGSLAGAIVVVEQADPGFDWLFSCGIGGLVTAWGGANSHMAVRCAELGIAAAIGCGEHLYRQAREAATACIDPVAGGLWLR
jgi:phosphohistidine swiveling domain-containing protein